MDWLGYIITVFEMQNFLGCFTTFSTSLPSFIGSNMKEISPQAVLRNRERVWERSNVLSKITTCSYIGDFKQFTHLKILHVVPLCQATLTGVGLIWFGLLRTDLRFGSSVREL